MPLDPFNAVHRPLSNELSWWASHESKSPTTEADLRAMVSTTRPAIERLPFGLLASLACKLMVWSGQVFWSD